MAERELAEVLRENAYLKRRNAQLQSDILDLTAENNRLRQIQDRLVPNLAARLGGCFWGRRCSPGGGGLCSSSYSSNWPRLLNHLILIITKVVKHGVSKSETGGRSGLSRQWRRL